MINIEYRIVDKIFNFLLSSKFIYLDKNYQNYIVFYHNRKRREIKKLKNNIKYYIFSILILISISANCTVNKKYKKYYLILLSIHWLLLLVHIDNQLINNFIIIYRTLFTLFMIFLILFFENLCKYNLI